MKARKWKRYWFGLAIWMLMPIFFIILLICGYIPNNYLDGIKMLVEFLVSAGGLFLALIIFLRSQEENAKQQYHAQSQRERLHSEQVKAILNGNRAQAEVLNSFMESQNNFFKETVSKIFNSSKKEDKSFQNSMRIYKISKIDAELADLNYLLDQAEFDQDKIKEWQFLRTKEEKAEQIKSKKKEIENIKDKIAELEKERIELENGN